MSKKKDVLSVISRMKAVTGVSSDSGLSEFFGGHKTMISNKKVRGSIPYEEASQLAIDHGISLDWLILGRGEAPDGVVAPIASADEVSSGAEFVEVPLYDLQAAAGDGRLFSEETVKSVLHFRRDWMVAEGLHAKDLVALDVAGDSMDGTLQEGDTVLVNRAVRSRDGVFLLRMGEGLRIKRVQWLVDGSVRLSSDNELYEPETVHPENLGQIEIIGHCHWRGGRVY